MPLRVLIFDLDGTLFDTRDMIYAQWATVLEKHGGAPHTREEVLAKVYGPFHEIMARILNTEDPELIAEAMSSFQEIRKQVEHLFKLYDGVHTTLQALQDRGFRLAAYTGSDNRAITMLEAQGMRAFFEQVVTAEDVTQHKPDPEGVRLILDRLNIEPSEAAMIGDAPAEIQMAKRAQLGLSVGMTHGLSTRAALAAERPDAILDDIPSLLHMSALAGVAA